MIGWSRWDWERSWVIGDKHGSVCTCMREDQGSSEGARGKDRELSVSTFTVRSPLNLVPSAHQATSIHQSPTAPHFTTATFLFIPAIFPLRVSTRNIDNLFPSFPPTDAARPAVLLQQIVCCSRYSASVVSCIFITTDRRSNCY